MYVFLIVIALFSLVHLIEVSAFFSRLSGVLSGYTALGYALQNSVFMLTRVFTMALLPLLGFIVDSKSSSVQYIGMVSLSLLSASFLGGVVIMFRERVVYSFSKVIDLYNERGGFLKSLVYFPLFLFDGKVELGKLALFSILRNSFFWGGFFVFGVYSISVFMSFWFGLVFYEYRATISQLSGVTNALATVLLTFYIEPRISSMIDKDKAASAGTISVLMAGRVAGTMFLGVVFLLSYFALYLK